MKNLKPIFDDKQGDKGIWSLIHFTKRKLSDDIQSREKDRLMDAIDEVLEDNSSIFNKQRKTNYFLYVAATLTLLISLTSFILLERKSIESSYGQITTLSLPDGSTVTLNGHSAISYSTIQWNLFKKRRVRLEGEAFFNVATVGDKGKKSKFQVVTDHFKVEVLGTRFNVNNRIENESVVLEEGNVQVFVTDKKLPLQMNPGDYIGYDASSGTIEQGTVLTEEYTSWKDKYLFLDNKTLGELAQIIASVYGKRVIFENKEDMDIPLEGKVPSDEIRVLIAAVRLAAKVDIRLENDVVVFTDSKEDNPI